MIEAIKEFHFEASHQLVGHKGKCANVHGHSYILQVAIAAKAPNMIKGASDEGFIMDFTDLKSVVKSSFIDPMDHAFLAKGDEPIVSTLKANGSKLYVLGFRTTVENMAQYICYGLLLAGIPVSWVRLWETASGSTIVHADDVKEGPQYNYYPYLLQDQD